MGDMINLIFDEQSYSDLLGTILPQLRFSSPAEYDQNLIDILGPPLLVEIDGLSFHIHPLIRTVSQSTELLKRRKS